MQDPAGLEDRKELPALEPKNEARLHEVRAVAEGPAARMSAVVMTAAALAPVAARGARLRREVAATPPTCPGRLPRPDRHLERHG